LLLTTILRARWVSTKIFGVVIYGRPLYHILIIDLFLGLRGSTGGPVGEAKLEGVVHVLDGGHVTSKRTELKNEIETIFLD
jgi:hypothetical protein